MKADKSEWARRYGKALGRYLELGPAARPRSARRLGGQAADLGLETLDVARIHRQSLLDLNLPKSPPKAKAKTIQRAETFFAEAIFPIEKTHPAARRADVRVKELTEQLRLRREQSSDVARRLEKSVARRRAAEGELKESGRRRDQLLRESRRLGDLLRRQMSEMLKAREDERKKTSRRLDDEIAQTLAAINVRLAALEEMTKTGTTRLEKEVALTQRLVGESAGKIKQAAYEIGLRPKK